MGLDALIGLDAGLHGVDTLAQAFRNPLGGGGGGGAGGYLHDPETTAFILQSLASGKPMPDVAREPGQGLIKYGLSRMGLMSPTVHATDTQKAAEQLALRGQASQKASDVGNIFESAGKIASVSPKLAQQFYGRMQQAEPDLGAVEPTTWESIFTRSQLAQQAELEKVRHDQFMERYLTEKQSLDTQKADALERSRDARDAASQARADAQLAALGIQGKRADAMAAYQTRQSQMGFVGNLLKMYAADPDPKVQKWAMDNLRSMSSSFGFSPPPEDSTPTDSASSGWHIPGFSRVPSGPAAAPKSATVPW